MHREWSTSLSRWRRRWLPTTAHAPRLEAMAYTHRKEFAQWVAEAKREETRQRRLVRAVEMLRQGKKLS